MLVTILAPKALGSLTAIELEHSRNRLVVVAVVVQVLMVVAELEVIDLQLDLLLYREIL